MAFEKAKVLKAAEKFLSQGKISAAIKEYRQIIDNDPNDLTTLNMLGDLLARAGKKEEAISCFYRIAEHYREEQFRLKAIAMYKKIEKLKPGDLQTAKNLATLYDAQGLVGDARAQYLIIADAYTRAGEIRKTLEVLHRIADLDSQNTEIRLKLADGYLKEQMLPEAGKAYADAAGRLMEKGEFEKSLNAYSKALELRPNDKHVLRGVVAAHAHLGTAEDSAELLEKAVADHPEDTEILSMLAQAYIDAGNPQGSERATAQLMTLDASNHRRYIDVARAYINSGEQTEASRILGLIAEQMLAGREENDLLDLVNELLTHDPDHVGGLRLLARIRWWQRDMDKLRSDLERLAEAAEAAGLTEDERYALTQLVRLAPDEPRFAERLDALGGSLEEGVEVPPFIDEPSAGVPSFESFSEMGATPEVTPVEDEFVWNSVAEETFVQDSNSSFADLNEPEIESHVIADAELIETSNQEVVFTGNEFAPSAGEEVGSNGEDGPRVDALMQQELESVDFYITQGYTDIALDTLELLEKQFGNHPEIQSRRAKLDQNRATPAEATITFDAVDEFAGDEFTSNAAAGGNADVEVAFAEVQDVETPPSVPLSPAPSNTPVASGIDSGLAEIFEEFRLEAESDHVSSNEDYETHYNMATAYKEMDLLDEAIREFQVAAGLAAPADGTPRYFQCCNMLGHCFMQKQMPRAAVLWLKKGLEAPGRTQDEYKALQYELGSAYEQMGDLQRAISTFTEVYGVDVGYRDIGERLQDLQLKSTQKPKKKKGK